MTFPDPKQAKATDAVADLLRDIRSRNPQATDAEIVEIIDRGLGRVFKVKIYCRGEAFEQ